MREKMLGALRSTGLSMQQMMILRLLATTGPLNQQELGAHCNLDKTTITELIDSLERARLARRQVSEADRRAKEILITAEGKKAVNRAVKLVDRAEQEFIALFSEREWATMQKCLSRYLESDGTDGKR